MPFAEIVTLEVGASIAKYILKLWLKDGSLSNDIASSVIDLLKSKTSDKLAQQQGNRQFEIIGEKIGQSLLPFFEREGARLDDGDRTAIAYAVAETFNHSTLTTQVLIEHNLEPTELSQYILKSSSTVTMQFSEAGTMLYTRIIQEACKCIVDIASQLPSFTETSFAEVLKRENLLLSKVDKVLSELQKVREHLLLIENAKSYAPPPRSELLWTVPYLHNPLFTGREETLHQIHDHLTTSKTAALTQAITGLGGIGKTQTALEYTYRYQQDYQAIFWLRASSREEIIEDYTIIAQLLQLPERTAPEKQQIVQASIRWLQHHPGWLLVFDNADDLGIVKPYLPAGTKGHILITTRAQAIISIAQKIDLDIMPVEEGIQFLLQRAGLDTLSKQLSREDQIAAETIVQELGCLPLALDQAGAYIEETGTDLSNYLVLYRKQRKDLLAHRGGIDEIHRPVATTWSLAFDNLATTYPAALDLLRVCTFFAPDAIPEEMLMQGAHYVSPHLQPATEKQMEWNQCFAALRKYSLLRRQVETQTLSLHRLVQAVIYEMMDGAEQRGWAQRAVQMVNAIFPSNEQAPWTLSQRYIIDALRCFEEALQLQLATKEIENIGFNIALYLQNRGQYTKAEALYQQVLSSQGRQLGAEHPDTLRTRNSLANLYSQQGKYREAEALYQQVLSSRERQLGAEHPNTLRTRHALATLYKDQGKYQEAEALYQQVLSSRERQLGAEHPDTLRTRHALAILLQRPG